MTVYSHSLRRRLVTWVSLPILTATLIAVLISYFFARHEVEEVYDAQLVHSAKVLLQLTQHEILEDEAFDLGIENPELQHRYERKLAFRIWYGSKLITHSPNTDMFGAFEAPPGFSNQEIGNDPWRFFVFLDPVNKIKIEVSERYDIRYELIIQLMSALLLPAIIFIPVIFLIVWFGVRSVLKPVVSISTDVDRRSSDDLSSIPLDNVPQEIAPLLLALNRLFSRITDSFRREREFTDHAAHELRTPLAAMKTQTQVLMKKAARLPECAEGLENLESSINRATRMVEQLLALARLQNEKLPKNRINLSDILQDVVAEHRVRADEKSITLTSSIAEDIFVSGHEGSVGILLGNLIDNAIKYTPVGGRVDIGLNDHALLFIRDTGPGIANADKERVFNRFVRVDQTGQTGSGLGLSIAQWIAAAHDITINLADNVPHGLTVSIQWNGLS